MKSFSKKWMQSFLEGNLPDNKTIIDQMSRKAFEVEDVTESADSDSLFEIKVLPNRIADAYSVSGMAKELSALFDLKFKDDFYSKDISTYTTNNDFVSTNGENLPLYIFTGLKLKFDNSQETPEWIKDILVKSGGRSINLLVDITNLMLFSFGQPAHVFDFEKLQGNIVTRYAENGEELELLDGKKVVLTDTDYVIADEKRALSVAGIKGGKLAEVDKNTKVAVFEMANFNPTMIRKTSQRLNLRTDASKIFENGITTAKTEQALAVLISTVKELNKNAEIEFIINKKIEDKLPTWVDLKFADINNYAGKEIPKEEILDLLKRQAFEVEVNGENLRVKASDDRLDVNIAEDVVEEVLRIYGFDNLESRPIVLKEKVNQNTRFLFENFFKLKMLSKGFTEVFSYTFVNTGDVKVKAGLAEDKMFLRNNLVDGAKNAFTKNYNYLPILQTDTLKFFEIGTIFGPNEKEEKRCIVVCDDNKKKTKYVESLLEIISEIEQELGLSKINVEVVGEKPAIVEFSIDKVVEEINDKNITVPFLEREISLQDIKYKPISIYPFIVRDIAMFVPTDFSFESLKADLQKLNLENVENIYMFDSFTKQDENGNSKTSVAFRIIFQSYSKTLTDSEVEAEIMKVYEHLKGNNFEIR